MEAKKIHLHKYANILDKYASLEYNATILGRKLQTVRQGERKMKKQKTAPAESAVQTEKKGTGIQIDKKTVFGITALLLVIMLLAGVLTQVVPRGEYQMDDSGMVINGTYQRESESLCSLFSSAEHFLYSTAAACSNI